jgi:hypothetical protein
MLFACVRDRHVESAWTFEGLLSALAGVQEVHEDVAIWLEGRVVAVRHGDGCLSFPRHAVAVGRCGHAAAVRFARGDPSGG